MVVKSDQERVKALLSEAITVLCKNGLSYRSEFCVEGLLGITLDQNEVFLVNIKETIKNYEDPPVPGGEEDPHNGTLQTRTPSSKRPVPVPVHVFHSRPSPKSRSRRKRSVEVESSSNRSTESSRTFHTVPTDPTQLSLTDDNLFSTAFEDNSSSINNVRQEIDSEPPSKRPATEEVEEAVEEEVSQGSKAENPILVKEEHVSDEEDVEEVEQYEDSKHELTISHTHSTGVSDMNPSTSQEQFVVAEEMPGCSSWSAQSAAASYTTSQALVPSSQSQEATASSTSGEQQKEMALISEEDGHVHDIMSANAVWIPTSPSGSILKQWKAIRSSSTALEDSEDLDTSAVDKRYKFKCDECSYVASRSYNLKRHMLLHVGYNITCHACGKKFRDNYTLQKHACHISYTYTSP